MKKYKQSISAEYLNDWEILLLFLNITSSYFTSNPLFEYVLF